MNPASDIPAAPYELGLVLAAPVLLVAAACLIVGGRLLWDAMRRVALALIPVIVVAGLVIGLVIVPAKDRLGEAAPALIAGTVLAAGWLATFLAAAYQKEIDREQTRNDTMLALREEMFTIVEKLDDQPIDKAAREIQALIARGGSGARAYHFFSTTESPTTVYDSVASNIVTLDPAVLEPVVRFYAAYSDLSAFVEDVRSETFRRLAAPRRVNMHKGLTRHRKVTLHNGLKAIYAINLALELAQPAKIARSGRNPLINEEKLQ